MKILPYILCVIIGALLFWNLSMQLKPTKVEYVQAGTAILSPVHDTVYAVKHDTLYRNRYITQVKDSIRADTLLIVMDFNDSVREYHRSYEIGNSCIDVHSLIMQNVLARQTVDLTTTDLTNSVKTKNVKRFSIGIELNNIPSHPALYLDGHYLTKDYLYTVGWNPSGKEWKAGISKVLF